MDRFTTPNDVIRTYVQLEIATRDRLRKLWAFVRDDIDDPEAFKVETIDSLTETGCDPKRFRDEFNLAMAMGPFDDAHSHPFAFTPQMQSAIGKVAEVAGVDRDDAWAMICESHPTTGASKILSLIPEIAGKAAQDAIDKAIALLSDNLTDERVVAFMSA